jgi:hypothetical protein
MDGGPHFCHGYTILVDKNEPFETRGNAFSFDVQQVPQ